MKNTKKIVMASLCASLGVIFLYLGVLISVMDMSAALLASFMVLFCVMELGYSYAFAVYVMISVLALVLLPSPAPAWMFLLLFGYIPIAKFGFEHIFKKMAWIPKILLFNLLYAAMIFLGGELLGFTTDNQLGIPPIAIQIAFFAVGNVLYVVCDVLYGRLALIYIRKIRDRIYKYLK